MSGQNTPAGWYPDPHDPSQQRYWDGSSWSEATQPAAPGVGVPPPPATTGGFPAPPPYGGTAYGAPGYGAAPVGYGYGAVGPAPNNYMVFAILSTLFCCLPAGIVSIVKASQVNKKWSAGDATGAQEASNQARTWAIVSAVLGILVFGLIAATGGFSFEASTT